MTEHALRIDPQPFADLLSGAKTCEIRNDDRGFQVGDTIQLHEREDADFTGRTLRRTITHIQRGYGLPDGLCVLSYAIPAAPQQAVTMPESEGSAAQKSFWAGFEAAHLSKSTNIREAWNHYKATDEFARLNADRSAQGEKP